MKEMNIAHDKINVFGGAVALGHPIGIPVAELSLP
jgi:acetyl-CoA acetyltransferase